MAARTIHLLNVSIKGEQICNGGSSIEEEVMGHEDWHCIHTTFRKISRRVKLCDPYIVMVNLEKDVLL